MAEQQKENVLLIRNKVSERVVFVKANLPLDGYKSEWKTCVTEKIEHPDQFLTIQLKNTETEFDTLSAIISRHPNVNHFIFVNWINCNSLPDEFWDNDFPTQFCACILKKSDGERLLDVVTSSPLGDIEVKLCPDLLGCKVYETGKVLWYPLIGNHTLPELVREACSTNIQDHISYLLIISQFCRFIPNEQLIILKGRIMKASFGKEALLHLFIFANLRASNRNQDFKLLMEDFIRRFEHLIKDQNQSFRQTIKDVMERGDFLMTDNFQDISSLFVEISKATLAMLGVDLSKGALKPRTFRWATIHLLFGTKVSDVRQLAEAGKQIFPSKGTLTKDDIDDIVIAIQFGYSLDMPNELLFSGKDLALLMISSRRKIQINTLLSEFFKINPKCGSHFHKYFLDYLKTICEMTRPASDTVADLLKLSDPHLTSPDHVLEGEIPSVLELQREFRHFMKRLIKLNKSESNTIFKEVLLFLGSCQSKAKLPVFQELIVSTCVESCNLDSLQSLKAKSKSGSTKLTLFAIEHLNKAYNGEVVVWTDPVPMPFHWYWEILEHACQLARPLEHDLSCFSEYAIFSELLSLYGAYAKSFSLEGPLQSIPSVVEVEKCEHMKNYFRWILDLHSYVKRWQERVSRNAFTYQEILQLAELKESIGDLIKNLHISAGNLAHEMVEARRIEMYRLFNSVKNMLFWKSEDGKMCSVFAIFMEHSLVIPSQLVGLLKEAVTDCDRKLISNIVFSASQVHVNADIFASTLTLETLHSLYDALRDYLTPFRNHFKFIIHFMRYNSQFFEAYLREKMAENIRSRSTSTEIGRRSAFTERAIPPEVYCNVLREIKEYFSRIVNGIEPFPFFLCSVLRKDRNIVEEVILLLTFEGDEGNKTNPRFQIDRGYEMLKKRLSHPFFEKEALLHMIIIHRMSNLNSLERSANMKDYIELFINKFESLSVSENSLSLSKTIKDTISRITRRNRMQQKLNFEDFIEISKAAVMMAKMSSTINRRANIGRRLSWMFVYLKFVTSSSNYTPYIGMCRKIVDAIEPFAATEEDLNDILMSMQFGYSFDMPKDLLFSGEDLVQFLVKKGRCTQFSRLQDIADTLKDLLLKSQPHLHAFLMSSFSAVKTYFKTREQLLCRLVTSGDFSDVVKEGVRFLCAVAGYFSDPSPDPDSVHESMLVWWRELLGLVVVNHTDLAIEMYNQMSLGLKGPKGSLKLAIAAHLKDNFHQMIQENLSAFTLDHFVVYYKHIHNPNISSEVLEEFLKEIEKDKLEGHVGSNLKFSSLINEFFRNNPQCDSHYHKCFLDYIKCSCEMTRPTTDIVSSLLKLTDPHLLSPVNVSKTKVADILKLKAEFRQYLIQIIKEKGITSKALSDSLLFLAALVRNKGHLSPIQKIVLAACIEFCKVENLNELTASEDAQSESIRLTLFALEQLETAYSHDQTQWKRAVVAPMSWYWILLVKACELVTPQNLESDTWCMNPAPVAKLLSAFEAYNRCFTPQGHLESIPEVVHKTNNRYVKSYFTWVMKLQQAVDRWQQRLSNNKCSQLELLQSAVLQIPLGRIAKSLHVKFLPAISMQAGEIITHQFGQAYLQDFKDSRVDYSNSEPNNISNLILELADVKTDYQLMKNHSQALDVFARSTASRLQYFEAEVQETIEQLQEKSTEKYEEMKDLLVSENNLLKQSLIKLKDEDETKKQSLAELQEENQATKQMLAELQEENKSTKQSLSRVKSHYQKMNGENRIMKQSAAQMEEDNHEMKQSLGEVRELVNRLQRVNDGALARMQELTRENDQTKQETKRLQTEISLLDQRLKQLELTWAINPEELTVTEECLGKGGWGVVKMGLYHGTPVAVKTIYEVLVSPNNYELFKREMQIASIARHPNLVLFIGAVTHGKLTIVTELMETSLRNQLDLCKISDEHILSISKDITLALAYLHSRPKPIIHRDVSSANVLLNSKPNGWMAKLGDFGSANFLAKTNTIGPGSPLYAPPESTDPNKHSVKMDVYSFGILLLEMCNGMSDPDKLQMVRQSVVTWREPKKAIGLLAVQCTFQNIDRRPNMTEVDSCLKKL